jgi:hypothetical protein
MISVSGATPNSTVTLKRFKYITGSPNYSADVGSTDENGNFEYATTPAPPSQTGNYLAYVVVDGQWSNEAFYSLGVGIC